MLDLIVIITVKDLADVPAVADALTRMRPMCLAEPGCVSWEALHSEADPRRFTLVERWETRELWNAHDDLAAIQSVYLPEILPVVDREVHVSRRL
ncbi:MAG TPA: antibiotic biosynthesis monooxygenase family protein [Actinokineospora sp.]|nr:antibiotic biosynthesis monooxygenase family protein [Actinokineospora sp.]